MSNTLKTMAEMQYFNFSFEPGKEISNRISKSSGAPLISVITILSQNQRYEYLEQMYNSLQNQTFPYWEWIIIGKEESANVKDITKKDKRIKFFVNQSKTKDKAKIFAVKNAISDLIFYFEENDLLDKTLLECGYFAMFFSQESYIAYSNMVEFGEKELLADRDLEFSNLKKIILPSVFIRRNELLRLDKNFVKSTKERILEEKLLIKKDISIKMNFYGYWHRNLKIDVKLNDENDSITTLSNGELNTISNRSSIINCDNNGEVDYKNIPEIVDIGKNPIFSTDNKKRILLILPWTALGGAEIFDINLIKGLKKKGYEISVITTQRCGYILRQEVEKYVEEYFDITSFLKRKDWTSFIAYIIKSRKINLVFISNSFYGYYALPWLKCQFKDIPFVDYIHSENWNLRNGGKPKDSNAVADYLDETYTCTKYLKNLMYKKMNRSVKNVRDVYIGTDINFFDPSIKLEKEQELKEMYKGKKVILLVCRVVHAKRPIFAIDVVKKILEYRNDVKLAIVGDGIALEDVKEYIKETDMQNVVDCFGYQQDVRPFYKVANATIICSLQEGLALVTYESLSMGVPVVSADVGGQKELVGNDCGALIEQYQKLEEQLNFNYSDEEIQKYVDALLDVLDREEKTNIREHCRNKVVNKFSINKMIDTLDIQFTNLINNGSKVKGAFLENIALAERFLLVNSILESKEEREKE